MDIFAFANESLEQDKQIQEEIKKDEEKPKPKKPQLDIFEVLGHIARKDYGWLAEETGGLNYEEKVKAFEPYIVNMFMAKMIGDPKTKKLTTADKAYFYLLGQTNELLNKNIFWVDKKMSWLLACTVNEFNIDNFNMDRINVMPKGKSAKIDSKVLDYISKELQESKTKVKEMIDQGFITTDDIKSIKKMLDTLEKPKK